MQKYVVWDTALSALFVCLKPNYAGDSGIFSHLKSVAEYHHVIFFTKWSRRGKAASKPSGEASVAKMAGGKNARWCMRIVDRNPYTEDVINTASGEGGAYRSGELTV